MQEGMLKENIAAPVSVCSMEDIEYTIQLITEAINNL